MLSVYIIPFLEYFNLHSFYAALLFQWMDRDGVDARAEQQIRETQTECFDETNKLLFIL